MPKRSGSLLRAVWFDAGSTLEVARQRLPGCTDLTRSSHERQRASTAGPSLRDTHLQPMVHPRFQQTCTAASGRPTAGQAGASKHCWQSPRWWACESLGSDGLCIVSACLLRTSTACTQSHVLRCLRTWGKQQEIVQEHEETESNYCAVLRTEVAELPSEAHCSQRPARHRDRPWQRNWLARCWLRWLHWLHWLH